MHLWIYIKVLKLNKAVIVPVEFYAAYILKLVRQVNTSGSSSVHKIAEQSYISVDLNWRQEHFGSHWHGFAPT